MSVFAPQWLSDQQSATAVPLSNLRWSHHAGLIDGGDVPLCMKQLFRGGMPGVGSMDTAVLWQYDGIRIQRHLDIRCSARKRTYCVRSRGVCLRVDVTCPLYPASWHVLLMHVPHLLGLNVTAATRLVY